MIRSIKYRLYPTKTDATVLLSWMRSARWLWNLCHEQRVSGLHRSEKVYPSAYGQQKELTTLKQLPEWEWLNSTPRVVLDSMIENLDMAWKACFRMKRGVPRWKKRTDPISLSFKGTCSIDAESVRLPLLGRVGYRQHKPLPGQPRCFAVMQDIDEWYLTISCEVGEPQATRTDKPAIGIDVGVKVLAATSDGELIPNLSSEHKLARKVEHAQKALSRRKPGSKRRERARVKLAKANRLLRRSRKFYLHCVSKRLTDRYGKIAVEGLVIPEMVQAQPGEGRARKAALNRSILSSGWSSLKGQVKYKAVEKGGEMIEVMAPYTSQTCAECGHVSPDNRRTQAEFVCVKCGHAENADVNAAKNILTRALVGMTVKKKEKVLLRKSRRKSNVLPLPLEED